MGVFRMKEPFDDSTINYEQAFYELYERTSAQWKEMTPEEREIYNAVLNTIVPKDSGKFIATAVRENFFRNHTVEELEEILREKYGLSVKLNERLRTALQDMQDFDKYLSIRIAFSE